MQECPRELNLVLYELFIIMINDLELAISNTSHWKYVDDVSLSEIVNIMTLHHCHRTLVQVDAGRGNNNMKWNSNKWKEMIISFLRGKISLLVYV